MNEDKTMSNTLKTSYICYFGRITEFGAQNLMCTVANEITNGCEHIYLCISSKGGCNFSALTLYNYLHNIPVKFTTHNIGFVESAANIVFLAASERLASPNSCFVIHGSKSGFKNDTKFSSDELQEATDSLINDQRMFSNIISSSIGYNEETVSLWFKTSKLFTSSDAIDSNLISSSEDFTMPTNRSFIGINTEPLKS